MTGTVVIEKRDADGVWRELEQPHPYRARITHAPSGRDLSDALMRMWARADMWRAHNTPFVTFVHPDTATSIRDELAREQERARIAAPLPTKHPLPLGTLVWVAGGFAATVCGRRDGHMGALYRVNPTEGWRGQMSAAESAVAVFDPHWNEKRAYRQGKTIQCRSHLACAKWVDCQQTRAGVPQWAPHCEYRVKPGTPPPAAKPKTPRSEEPWHARFDRAIKAGVPVQYRESEDHAWQDNRGGTDLSYCYGEGNYRIGGELDPYAHLKAAALNGLRIQRRTSRGFWIDRVPARVFKHWSYPPSHYRVKPQEA